MGLVCEGVSFAYRRGRPVLCEVSLRFEPGTVTAIVGPNGAGKTTLLRLLLGLRRPDTGRVTIDTRPVHALPARERAARLAYVPQRGRLAFAYTVGEVIRLGRFADPGDRVRGAIANALRAVDLETLRDEPFERLSAGQQQRVLIARALVQLAAPCADGASRALIADEPLSALDPRHAIEAVSMMRDLTRREPTLAAVLVLHDLTTALRFADRAAVLDGAGRLAALGPVGETLRPDVLRGVFGVPFALVHGDGGRGLLPAAPAHAPASG